MKNQPQNQPHTDAPAATPTNDARTMRAWAFYDWANSSYALVINTALFPLYFQSIMSAPDAPETLRLFGYSITPNAAYSYSLSLSFLILVVLSPMLSSIAGSRGNKRSFLQFFCTLGAFSCMGLFFFQSAQQVMWALLFNITASIGFYGSLVFYNAYLPEIATPDRQDALSARGFALGYVGSLLMLMISLLLVQWVATPENRGFYTRLCFFLTGCWWLGFAQYSFARLPKNRTLSAQQTRAFEQQSYWDLFTDSFEELRTTVRELIKGKRLKWFLTSFFLYSVGMQTIFLIATFIGKEIHLSESLMIVTIMLLQVEAIIGALLFAWLSRKMGNAQVLMIAVVMWIVACALIYRLSADDPNGQTHFFIIAALVGLVMGGLQSLSRSSYSKLLPTTHDSATFFSFYDILEKAAIIVGTGLHGYWINRTGHTQMSSLMLGLFFVAALMTLQRLAYYQKKADLNVSH